MKTLSLDLRSAEVLTKSELKKVAGGSISYCYCHSINGDFLGTIGNYDGSDCNGLCEELYGEWTYHEENMVPGL